MQFAMILSLGEARKDKKKWALVAWGKLGFLKMAGCIGLRDLEILSVVMGDKTWW
jgi:hypothetical protein